MTEYELGYLLNEYQNSFQAQLMNVFSILSAFAIVSFLAAHRLSRTMVTVSMALFTFWLWMEIWGMLGRTRQILTLRTHIQQVFRESGKMSWHISNQTSITPAWLTENLPTIFLSVAVFCYVAALFFFFHCRRLNLKAETPAQQTVTTA
ncbi:MAG: hypothetical protein ABL973_20555 [Micropepsaceae bacterium]